MENYRLLFFGQAGYDKKGFKTEKEAILWAAHEERVGNITAMKLQKYDESGKEYHTIADLSLETVEVDLPHDGQNKTYYLTYIQSNTSCEILVDAPTSKAAERYFRSSNPGARSISAQEARPDDLRPEIPVLTLTKLEERVQRDNFLSLNIDELDLSVRAYNCLRRAGIDTIRELICTTEEELKHLPYLGWKCLEEIKSILAAQGESLEPGQEKEITSTHKPSLDARIRSVAHYAEDKNVKEAVLQSDKLRNMTLNMCDKIPGYTQLSTEDKNKLYDLVKKAISLSMEKENNQVVTR